MSEPVRSEPEHSEPEHSEPGPTVDGYLDELFDRLAGTGASGRRALTEAEDHLRTAVDEAVAAGLSPQQAETRAVSRFGPVATVAGEFRRAHRRAGWLAALSGTWLLAGLFVTGLALTYLGAALDVAVVRYRHPSAVPFCQMVGADNITRPCPGEASLPVGAALAGAVVLLVGLALLAGRVVTVRRTGLLPVSRRFPALAAGTFVAVAAALVAWPPTDRLFTVWQGPGLRIAEIGAAVAVLIALGVAGWGVVRLRSAPGNGPAGSPSGG